MAIVMLYKYLMVGNVNGKYLRWNVIISSENFPKIVIFE